MSEASTSGGLTPREFSPDGTPINYRRIDCSRIGEEVAYALRQYQDLCRFAEMHDLRIDGASYLEIGPGFNYAQALLLKSRGAKVAVLDQFAPQWQEYHRLFYTELLQAVDGDAQAVRDCLESDAHIGVDCFEEPAEAMRSIPDASCSLVYSCAVFEHACHPENLDRVCAELARISSPGALHLHYIDLRNHGDLKGNPFGHLLWSNQAFAEMNRARHQEYGTRLRASEFWLALEKQGMEVLERRPTLTEKIPASQLQAIRSTPASSYCLWPQEDLEVLSVCFELRKATDLTQSTLLRQRAEQFALFQETIRQISFREPNLLERCRIAFFTQDGGQSPAKIWWIQCKNRWKNLVKQLFWRVSNGFWQTVRRLQGR